MTFDTYIAPDPVGMPGPSPIRRQGRRGRRATLVVLAGAVMLPTIASVAFADVTSAATLPQSSSVACDRWASSRGNDAHDGRTEATAVASLGTLAAALGPGQTGCIPAGDVFVAHGTGVIGASRGTAAAPITIRSGPGGRATIVGGVLLNDRARHVVMRDLDIRGDGFTGNAIHINGHDITLTGLEVQHPRGICIGVGTIEAYQSTYRGTEASGVTISSSRIHQCGTDPSLAHRHDDARFSGSHGIYVVNARGTRIVDNAIHDNQYRGVQVWPRGTDTLIERNVMVRNATHVNVGSVLSDGLPWRSTGTVIRNNVMADRVQGFQIAKNPAQVHGNFPSGTDPQGNVVTGNCVAPEVGPAVTGFGIAVASDNLEAQAVFARSGGTDLRMAPGSPCAGIGPSWAQPPAATTELRRAPRLVCSGVATTVELAELVATPSGQVAWSYSLVFHRAGAGDWQISPWLATVANTGAAEARWSLAAEGWQRVDHTLRLPDTTQTTVAWELRYEWAGGEWSHEWIGVGSCR